MAVMGPFDRSKTLCKFLPHCGGKLAVGSESSSRPMWVGHAICNPQFVSEQIQTDNKRKGSV